MCSSSRDTWLVRVLFHWRRRSDYPTGTGERRTLEVDVNVSIEKPLRILQIGGVESFLEAVVDGTNEIARMCVAAVLALNTSQTDDSAQLERVRLLLLRDGNRPLEARFSLRKAIVTVGYEQTLSLQPMEFSLVTALARRCSCGDRFVDNAKPRLVW